MHHIMKWQVRELIGEWVTNHQERKVSSTQLKKAFLADAEEFFESCFCEEFFAKLVPLTGPVDSGREVRLVLKPPFKRESPPFEETEPALEAASAEDGRSELLCTLEDVCNISLDEDGTGLELARRNGIPLRLAVRTRMEGRDLISHLAGFYRLCEKWTFSLSGELRYPASLDFCIPNNVHGPVTNNFVESKFKQKSKQR